MIILRNKYQQKEFSNAGIYIKQTLKGIGMGSVPFGILGGASTGGHPIGFLAGAIVGGTIGGIIGASTAKFYTPEEKTKRSILENERKALYDRIYKEYGFEKLIKISQNSKIIELLKKSECRGWDDYIYTTIAFEYKPWEYSSYSSKETIAWFGNIDSDGELTLDFKTEKVFLGKILVTPKNFKTILLKYFQKVITEWEENFKLEGENSRYNKEFIMLQKEIYNQVKQQL